jgi:hypothetical protein
MDAYGISMRLEGEIIGKLWHSFCEVFSAVYLESDRRGACVFMKVAWRGL